jgi:hypothetical protein
LLALAEADDVSRKRIGAKYDPEIPLDALLRELASDCPHWHTSDASA